MSGCCSLRTWMPVDAAGLHHNTGRRCGWRRNRSRSRVEHTSGCKAVTVGTLRDPGWTCVSRNQSNDLTLAKRFLWHCRNEGRGFLICFSRATGGRFCVTHDHHLGDFRGFLHQISGRHSRRVYQRLRDPVPGLGGAGLRSRKHRGLRFRQVWGAQIGVPTPLPSPGPWRIVKIRKSP